MRIYSRNGKLGYDIPAKESPTGRRVQKLTGASTEAEALKEGAKALLQLEEEAKVASGEVRRAYTWGEAVIRYIKEKQLDGKATLSYDIMKLKWMEQNIPDVSQLVLGDITRYWVYAHINEPLRFEGRTARTINHYVQVISHILNLAAAEWENESGLTWLEHAPKLKREKIPKDQRTRVRYLDYAEADRLIRELPDHLAAMARMAVATGLRASNVSFMRWEWVDLSRRMLIVPGDKAKGRLPISVPLSYEALQVLREQRFKHDTWVFPYKGKPVKNCSTAAWKKAKERAGITDFRWHDWRHTFASWHIQNGTSLEVLQELGGWEDAEMVKKYAHLNVDRMRVFVENTNIASRLEATVAR